MVVATEPLANLCREVARSFGAPEARIVVVGHPLGATPVETIREWADAAVDPVLSLFSA